MKAYFETLGLKSGASKVEVRLAFRTLLKQWHPDRHFGNPEMTLLAEQKTKEITYAYSRLLESPVCGSSAMPVCQKNGAVYRAWSSSSKFQTGRSSSASVPGSDAPHFGFETAGGRREPSFLGILVIVVVSLFSLVGCIHAAQKGIPGTPGVVKAERIQPKNPQSPDFRDAPTMAASEQGIGGFRPPQQISALLRSAAACELSGVRRELSRGADIEQRDALGNTALIWASRNNCASVVNLLLRQGANPNSPSFNGISPRTWAVNSGGVEVLREYTLAGVSA